MTIDFFPAQFIFLGALSDSYSFMSSQRSHFSLFWVKINFFFFENWFFPKKHTSCLYIFEHFNKRVLIPLIFCFFRKFSVYFASRKWWKLRFSEKETHFDRNGNRWRPQNWYGRQEYCRRRSRRAIADYRPWRSLLGGFHVDHRLVQLLRDWEAAASRYVWGIALCGEK